MANGLFEGLYLFRRIIAVILIIGGVIGFITAQGQINEFQTISGQIMRRLSVEQQNAYQEPQNLQIVSAVIGVLGGILLVIDLKNNNKIISNEKEDSGVLFSGYEHETIESNQFLNYTFSLSKPSILEYEFEVIDGKPINVIVTDKKELQRFKKFNNIDIYLDASQMNTKKHKTKTRLPSGDYSIILKQLKNQQI